MKKTARRIALSYIISDFTGASAAWGLFYLYRKYFIESGLYGDGFVVEIGYKFYFGIAVIPLFFIALFGLAGFYNDPLRRSRMLELGKSVTVTIAGVIILFFALVLDDSVGHYSTYYKSFVILAGLSFFLTWIPRFVITSLIARQIHLRKLGFRTLIAGSNGRAAQLVSEINSERMPAGNIIAGYVSSDNAGSDVIPGIRCLGSWNGINEIIERESIEEVIIAPEESEKRFVDDLVNKICHLDITVRAIPSLRNVTGGSVEAGPIYATPLLRISYRRMSDWQNAVKQVADYAVAAAALIVLSPLMGALSILILTSGRGPVIFRQERIGRHGKPFMIFKFRSMNEGAESNGPQLAVREDPRMTPVGKFMRRHRLDEIPNFINVLRGEMSLVGPRPERQHYIDLIREVDPRVNRVLAVKPGITCLGQVRLGYASDLQTMIRRMEYDLIYLENISLFLDAKILFYTLGTIIRGKGL